MGRSFKQFWYIFTSFEERFGHWSHTQLLTERFDFAFEILRYECIICGLCWWILGYERSILWHLSKHSRSGQLLLLLLLLTTSVVWLSTDFLKGRFWNLTQHHLFVFEGGTHAWIRLHRLSIPLKTTRVRTITTEGLVVPIAVHFKDLFRFRGLLRIWIIYLVRVQFLHLFFCDETSLVSKSLFGQILSTSVPNLFLLRTP